MFSHGPIYGYLAAPPAAHPVKPTHKRFVAACVSSNIGDFGHRGVIWVGEDGEAWEVGHTTCPSSRQYGKGDLVTFMLDSHGGIVWPGGAECPRRLNNAPAGVVKEVWG